MTPAMRLKLLQQLAGHGLMRVAERIQVHQMNVRHVSARLADRSGELSQLGVKSLAVFGSVARNEATAVSDVDLLVEFSRPIGLFDFVHVKNYLELVLGCPVDLVTPDALRPEMREQILKEAVGVTQGLDAAR